MTRWRLRIACWKPKARNTHSRYVIIIDFSTATMVARTRLSITLYVHCLLCCLLNNFFKLLRLLSWRLSKAVKEADRIILSACVHAYVVCVCV